MSDEYIPFLDLLQQVIRHGDNGKASREQVYASLGILSGESWQYNLYRLGIDGESCKRVDLQQAKSLAQSVLLCAIFGDSLNDDGFDEELTDQEVTP